MRKSPGSNIGASGWGRASSSSFDYFGLRSCRDSDTEALTGSELGDDALALAGFEKRQPVDQLLKSNLYESHTRGRAQIGRTSPRLPRCGYDSCKPLSAGKIVSVCYRCRCKVLS